MPNATAATAKPTAIVRGFAWRPSRLLTYIILIAGSCLMIMPLVWLIRSSLMDNSQIFIFPPQWIPDPFQWSNYPEALTSVPFGKYLMNTVTIEVFVLAGVLLTSVITAYSLARLQWRGRNVVFAVILGSMMLPSAVTIIPLFVFWRELNALDSLVPLIVPAWFGSGAYIGQGAFQIFLLRQFFLTIPKELDEAAYMDGGTPMTVLWRIILPLSTPALLVVGIFTFIDVWNNFLEPVLYLNSEEHFTLALGLATFKGLYNAQWGYLMAASMAMVAPIIVLFFVGQRYFIEGITLTGIKG
ncbi:carbohydrate ABC transporter permease [Cohnella boryungensis]|jgi:multiple sugar transport system permease protein|uniref:Carbohydrate ABC transporter permease n=1 Tax=Cohnella boryungensis TaxID=768479 RepID=A0ABV8SC60_9BACL